MRIRIILSNATNRYEMVFNSNIPKSISSHSKQLSAHLRNLVNNSSNGVFANGFQTGSGPMPLT